MDILEDHCLSDAKMEDAIQGGVASAVSKIDTPSGENKTEKIRGRLMVSRMFRDEDFQKKLSGVITNQFPNYQMVERQTLHMVNESAQCCIQISWLLYTSNHMDTITSTFGQSIT